MYQLGHYNSCFGIFDFYCPCSYFFICTVLNVIASVVSLHGVINCMRHGKVTHLHMERDNIKKCAGEAFF